MQDNYQTFFLINWIYLLLTEKVYLKKENSENYRLHQCIATIAVFKSILKISNNLHLILNPCTLKDLFTKGIFI